MRTTPGAPPWFEKLEIARKSIFTGIVSSRASAVRKKTEPFSTPISLRLPSRYRSEISAATSLHALAICSSVNRIRSIMGMARSPHAQVPTPAGARPYFKIKILQVLLVKHLDVDVRIDLAQQPDLAVLLGHQRLLHGGQLDVQVELRQVEVRREGLQHASRRVPRDGEAVRLVLPGDAVEIEQVGEDLFARMGKLGLLQTGLALRVRCRSEPVAGGSGTAAGLQRWERATRTVEQPRACAAASIDLRHWLAVEGLGVQDHVETCPARRFARRNRAWRSWRASAAHAP